MSGKNKWTIVPFIIAATFTLILLYFLTATGNSRRSEPLEAIPLSASVIVKINHPEKLIEKTAGDNPLWGELRQLPLFYKINRQLRFIDSLATHAPNVQQIINNPPSFMSMHLTGKDKISVMHAFSLPPRIKQKDIEDLVRGLVSNSGTVSNRKYEGIQISEVVLLDKSSVGNFYFTVYRDILILSFSVTVLEESIRQLVSGISLADDEGFERIYATAGKNVDANVFINFKEFPKSLSSFVKADFKSEVRSAKNFAVWTELDLNPLSEMILMNGFINPSDSVPTLSSVIARQSPQKITVDEVLPSSVSAFFSLSMSDPDKYFNDYREFLRNEGRLTAYTNILRSVNNTYGTNFPGDFVEIMDKEIALAINANYSQQGDPGVFFVIRIKSRAQAEAKFRSVLNSMASVESKPPGAYSIPYRFDADLTFTIYEMPVRNLVSKVFGQAFNILDNRYFIILDNYMVFSDSAESLKSLIHDFVLNKTLANDQSYKEFKLNLSPRSNLCFYFDLSQSQPFFSRFLTPSVGNAWQKNLSVFQKLRVAGFQLYENNNMLYGNFLIRHLSSFRASAQTVWESRLDTQAYFKPVFTLNHLTGENEVFVQDLKNNVYLINQAGRILWKIQLAESIVSDVFQIDYFRNGKLQFLFSTRNQIYLLDRNGNFVERYPVSLRSPSTNGIAVFDYEGNRDYRIFVACADRHIYCYNREGSLITGWEFGQSESEVTQPLNHFRIGERDFIVFGDRYKTYIVDRRGSSRVNVDAYFPRSANNNYVLNLSADGYGPSVVTSDTTGKVYFIGFNGNVRTVELPGTYTNHHFFDYKDLTGDNKPEYIFLEGDKMTVYSNNKSRLFTFRFGRPVTSKPVYYQFSASDRKLGIVSRDENLIYLINSNGELYEGFPLQGNTPFTIGNFGDSLSRFNLIVGSRDNFLYNYHVN